MKVVAVNHIGLKLKSLIAHFLDILLVIDGNVELFLATVQSFHLDGSMVQRPPG